MGTTGVPTNITDGPSEFTDIPGELKGIPSELKSTPCGYIGIISRQTASLMDQQVFLVNSKASLKDILALLTAQVDLLASLMNVNKLASLTAQVDSMAILVD